MFTVIQQFDPLHPYQLSSRHLIVHSIRPTGVAKFINKIPHVYPCKRIKLVGQFHVTGRKPEKGFRSSHALDINPQCVLSKTCRCAGNYQLLPLVPMYTEYFGKRVDRGKKNGREGKTERIRNRFQLVRKVEAVIFKSSSVSLNMVQLAISRVYWVSRWETYWIYMVFEVNYLMEKSLHSQFKFFFSTIFQCGAVGTQRYDMYRRLKFMAFD